MSSPRISVIVPIYKVEKYIDACLRSIQNQTFRDFEVILVNDGTPDKSIEIAKKYIETDSRFILFNKENGGLSNARNYGIERAKGEYFAFIDSDDRIAPRYLENLYRAIVRFKADVAICDFRLYYQNKNKICGSGSNLKNNRLYDTVDGLRELLSDRNMRFYVWNKLWKASLFRENGIRMTPMFYEDIVICSQLFCHVRKAVTISYPGYIYTRAFSKYKELSMSGTRINDYINTVPIVRKYLSEKSLYNKVKVPFSVHIMHVFLSVPLLVYQAKDDLEYGVVRNSISGMGKIIRSCRKPVADLPELIARDPIE